MLNDFAIREEDMPYLYSRAIIEDVFKVHVSYYD